MIKKLFPFIACALLLTGGCGPGKNPDPGSGQEQGGGDGGDQNVVTALTLHDNNSTAVDLEWTPFGTDSGASQYVVYVGGTAVKTLPDTTTTCLVGDLVPNATCNFKVVAKNAQGDNVAVSNTVTYKVPDVHFKKNVQVAYIGNFSKTVTQTMTLEGNLKFMQDNIARNKAATGDIQIRGLSITIPWNELHPAENTYDWKGLDDLVKFCGDNGIKCQLSLYAGMYSPDWIYAAGVKGINVTASSEAMYVPIPWDQKYMELLTNDIELLAEKYADDPRVQQVQVTGHTYGTLEMHAPDISDYTSQGIAISPQIILDNWKYWVDLWGKLFPAKDLVLVLSQMYSGGGNSYNSDLSRAVTDYFVTKYQGRAILSTHQLHGKWDIGPRLEAGGDNDPFRICKEYSDRAPNGHEMVASFSNPDRQGTMEMTILNLKYMGNPYFMQFWKNETTQGTFFGDMQQMYDKYKNMSYQQMKASLIAEGKYLP